MSIIFTYIAQSESLEKLEDLSVGTMNLFQRSNPAPQTLAYWTDSSCHTKREWLDLIQQQARNLNKVVMERVGRWGDGLEGVQGGLAQWWHRQQKEQVASHNKFFQSDIIAPFLGEWPQFNSQLTGKPNSQTPSKWPKIGVQGEVRKMGYV